MNGTQQDTANFSQLDPQGIFGAVLGGVAGRLIGGVLGGKRGQNIGGIAGKIGGGFLPFDVGPAAVAPPSDIELQNFWNVLKKIGQGVQTGLNIGQQIGIFADQPGLQPAAVAPPSDIELQSFWSVLKKIGQGVQTGLNVGQRLGIFADQPGLQPAAVAPPTDIELQSFWSVLKKIGQGVQTGVNIGQRLGIFADQPGLQPAAVAPPSDIELQSFWSVLKKIGQGVQTGAEHRSAARDLRRPARPAGQQSASPDDRPLAASAAGFAGDDAAATTGRPSLDYDSGARAPARAPSTGLHGDSDGESIGPNVTHAIHRARRAG